MTEEADALVALKGMLDKVAAIKIPSILRTGRPSEINPDENVQLPPQEKISQLESYLLLTAEGRQLAIQARLAASDEVQRLRQEVSDMEGWEIYMEGPRKNWTQPQVDAARRRLDPDKMRRVDRLSWLVREFDIQVRRLEGDDAVASRAYTMLTGS